MRVPGSSILITGASGSFGSAFLHQVCTTSTETWRRIICYSRDELKQSQLQQTLTDPRLRWFLGDVRDLERLKLACRDVQVIVHAAALKQVPALEYNPTEAVKTNILGSMNVATAALECGVERVLAVSTDKAVQAINLYGATKACMERLLLAMNAHAGPAFAIVRYGNVAGSRGSVIPLWQQQAAQGRPLTLTSGEMTRFWITLPQAVAFVEQALSVMTGGELFVPKMPSVRMAEVARCFSDAWDITGLRPGEKIHETVIAPHEAVVGLPSPYASDTNDWWLEGEALKAAVACV